MSETLLKIISILFFGFHTILILFNIFGWIKSVLFNKLFNLYGFLVSCIVFPSNGN